MDLCLLLSIHNSILSKAPNKTLTLGREGAGIIMFTSKLKAISSAIQVAREAIRLMITASWKRVVLLCVNLTVLGVVPVIMAWIAKLIVDIVAKNITGNIYLYIIAEAVLALLFLLALKTQSLLQDSLRHRVNAYLKQEVAAHTSKQAISLFDDAQKQNLLQRAWQEIGFRPLLLLTSLTSIVKDVITASTFLILICTIHPIFALVLVLAALPALFFSPQSSTVVYDIHLRATVEARRTEYLEQLLIKPQAAKEVRLFNLAPWFLEQIKAFYVKWLKDNDRALWLRMVQMFTTESIMVVVQYGAYAFIAIQALKGNFTIGTFTFLVAVLKMLQSSLGQISSQLASLNEQRLFLTELTTYLDSEYALTNGSKKVDSDNVGTLSFHDVSFAYPNSDKLVIEDMNLTLRAGEATALVGANGAGKTTLVKLITRLYDTTSGKITLDDVNLKDYDLVDLRSQFATVMQDFGKYAFSLKENITLNKTFDQRTFADALSNSQVSDFIDAMPKKLDTALSRQFDTDGIELSGGQWQRVALARAMYGNAPILILDEPSSALDVEAEEELFRAYKTLTQNRISLLITHRFNTVQFADRILVLEDGKIVEDGSHQELMSLGGKYAAMFSKQRSAYEI